MMNLAQQIQQLVSRVVGTAIPLVIRAWDGSRSDVGETNANPVLHIKHSNALRRVLWRPGELGLAQAYVLGEIDLEGDLSAVFPVVWDRVLDSGRRPRVTPAIAWAALRLATRHGLLGPPPPPPTAQAVLTGRLNSVDRDRAAIKFHYDLSNEFYGLILDERMVYSCGYWREDRIGYGLADAQRDKLDLVCRKLGMEPGMRLLDVGCGWGALAIHAAERYGATVVGVTLSRRQFEFARDRAASKGLSDRIEFRLQDYRDVSEEPFDAVSAIEMGEHVGADNYPRFAAALRAMLRPRGRLLIQQMSRGALAPGGGAFIESFIAPDMHMRPVGQTVDLLETAGLEVREAQSMREHYVTTVRCWLSTLEDRWDEAVALVGETTARVWRLYLTGGALAFERHRMGVDQILSVATDSSGTSAMPTVPDWAPGRGRLIDDGGPS